MKSRFPKKTFIVVICLFALVRVALPFVVQKQLNQFLANFSEVYEFSVGDVDLAIWRGAYRLENVVGQLKNKNHIFFKAEAIDISLAWRDLFRGQLRTDILGEGVDVKITQELLAAAREHTEASKKDAQKLGDTVFPVRISSISLRTSTASFSDVQGLPPELQLHLSQIDGRVSNVTATEKGPNSLLKMKAVVQDSATGYITAEINQKAIPVDWLFSFEIKEFNLTSLNAFLKRQVPLSFKSGHADIYSELKGEKGNVYGYVKPFLKNTEIIGDQSDFKNVKHWLVEVAASLSKLILRNSEDKSVATKFNFSYEAGNFKWSLGKTLSEAFEHGFGGGLEPGIENQFKLDNQNVEVIQQQ